MSDLRSFWTNLLDPYGRNRGPAENPQRRSYADFAATGQYAAPTYAEDIATARTPRAPLSSVLTTGEPQPEVNGIGGPASPARDIIPNAPQGPSQAELEAQAMRDAMARAHALRGEPLYDPNLDTQWRGDRTELDRAREQYAAAEAERARREGVSFEEWWRFGGRQSEDWTPDQPAYRLARLTQHTQQAQRRLGEARR